MWGVFDADMISGVEKIWTEKMFKEKKKKEFPSSLLYISLFLLSIRNV